MIARYEKGYSDALALMFPVLCEDPRGCGEVAVTSSGVGRGDLSVCLLHA